MASTLVLDLEFNPKNGSALYLAQGASLLRVDALNTTPLATNITPNLSGKSANLIKEIAIDPFNATVATTMYVGTINGVGGGVLWKTSNAQAAVPTWTQYTPADGLPNVDVNSLQLNEATGKLVAFTWGRGAYMLAPPIDLVSTSVGPTLIIPGSLTTLNDTVCNQGYNAAAGFVVRYYLSSDAQITATDQLVGTRTLTGLAGNACNSGTISWNVSASQKQGDFYIGVIADGRAAVVEGTEGNNTLAKKTVIRTNSDLLLTSITSTVVTTVKSNGTTTYKLSVGDQVKNQGTGTTAIGFSVGYYLSTDTEYSSNDIYVCNRVVSTLAANAANPPTGTVSTSCSFPATAVKGAQYYVIGMADYLKAVVEIDENNNNKSTTTQITVP